MLEVKEPFETHAFSRVFHLSLRLPRRFLLLRIFDDDDNDPRQRLTPDVSTGPLARPFTRSLAQLTHLLAPHCSLHSRVPQHSFVRSLACSPAHSRARGNVNDWISQYPAVLTYSALVEDRMSWVEQWTQAIGELIGGDSTSPMMKQLLAHIVLRYVW